VQAHGDDGMQMMRAGAKLAAFEGRQRWHRESVT
jgi:hypothetical protein